MFGNSGQRADAAAMRANEKTTFGEQIEIAARSNRRNPKTADYFFNRDAAGLAENLNNLTPAFLGQ